MAMERAAGEYFCLFGGYLLHPLAEFLSWTVQNLVKIKALLQYSE